MENKKEARVVMMSATRVGHTERESLGVGASSWALVPETLGDKTTSPVVWVRIGQAWLQGGTLARTMGVKAVPAMLG